MTEQQGDKIIALLTQIRDGLRDAPDERTPEQREEARQRRQDRINEIEARLAEQRED